MNIVQVHKALTLFPRIKSLMECVPYRNNILLYPVKKLLKANSVCSIFNVINKRISWHMNQCPDSYYLKTQLAQVNLQWIGSLPFIKPLPQNMPVVISELWPEVILSTIRCFSKKKQNRQWLQIKRKFLDQIYYL